jgi:biopolymer transport protein ExbB
MKRISYLLISASFTFLAATHAEEAPQENVLLIEEELNEFAADTDPMEIPFENDDFLAEVDELMIAPAANKLSEKPAVIQKAEPQKNEMKPVAIAPAPVVKKVVAKPTSPSVEISLKQVFAGSPVIYSLLFLMSISAVGIWLYTQMHLRFSQVMPAHLLSNLRSKLMSNQYDDALALCEQHRSFFSKMIATGIQSRKAGIQVMADVMRSEGKRATVNYWQKIALLNDIAIIAPMIGLLGTVLGMFYAFYDLNRSMESVSNLFDGFGVSVGTTVAGLLVAIIAMMLHSLIKYRLTKTLTLVENEAHTLASLIDSKASLLQDR